MVDQAHILNGQILRIWRWVDVEAWEWENSSALPLLNGGFDFRSPHEIRPVRGGRPVLRDRDIVVRAANLVFRAVAAEELSVLALLGPSRGKHLPLGEVLVTSDVSTLADGLLVCFRGGRREDW